MEIKIEWTEPVLQDLETIVSYIENEWSEAIAHNFVDELLERVQTLSKQPFIGMASQKQADIRSIKISKHDLLSNEK